MMLFEKPSLAPSTFARGEAATLGEIYDAAYDSAIHVDNLNARQVSMDEAYDARISAIKGALGVDLPHPGRVKYGGGKAPPRVYTEDEFDAQLRSLAQQYPDKRDVIRPDFTPRSEAQKTAAAAEGRLLDARSRTPGLSKYAVEFAGGFRASFEDPFQVATLGVGPWRNVGVGAKAVIMSALKQGAANAGVVAAMQGDVQNWRKEAGLDFGFSQAAANVAMGFAFGATIDGGGRALYRGVRNLRGDTPTLDARGGVNGWGKPEDALEAAIPNLPEGDLVRQAAAGDVAALKELSKQTGVDGDPAVQGALRALDIEAGLDHRVLGIDDFDADSKFLQALRAADDPDEPAPRGATPVSEPRHASMADDAPAPLRSFEIEGKPVTFREVSPRDTVTDASTFQFKGGGDAAGATERLSGVQTWDPLAAGKAVVFERTDGTLVIADGHQRDALAKRLIDQDPKLQAFVFREADGWTARDVRALAAKKNLQEGSGSVIDAAKIMRERPDIIDRSVPLGSEAMRQARALARLSDDAFADVAAGMAPANYAALVADLVEDRARHGSVLREVMQASPANVREARFMVGDILQAETVHEAQLTLLGAEHITRSLLPERAKVLDGAIKLLRDDARIFGLLTREQRRIEAAGNRLSGGNADQALQAAAVQEAIEQLAATRGKVSDWLSEAARATTNGLPVKQTSEAFARRVRETLERDGIKGLSAEPETLRGGGFDEPAGEDARLQVEDLERELGEEITFAQTPEKVIEREAQLYKLLDYVTDTGLDATARRNDATSILKIRPWSKHPGRVLAFHGTEANFEKFDLAATQDFGLHFGTADQANQFAKGPKYRRSRSADGESGRVLPVVLDLKRVIDLKDLGDWRPALMKSELERAGVRMSREASAQFDRAARLSDDEPAYRILREDLTKQGYDGIRYLNQAEGAGVTWSYIVWEQGKVKSATDSGAQLYALPSQLKHERRLVGPLSTTRLSLYEVEREILRLDEYIQRARQDEMPANEKAARITRLEKWRSEYVDMLPKFDADLPAGKPFQRSKVFAAGDDLVVRLTTDERHGASAESKSFRIYPKPDRPLETLRQPSKELGVPLGEVSVLQHADGRWEVDMVEVRPRARGKGVAKALYAAVEAELGIEMKPSGILLPDGYAMWSRRNPQLIMHHRLVEGVWWSPKRLIKRAAELDKRAETSLQLAGKILGGTREATSQWDLEWRLKDAESYDRIAQQYRAALDSVPPEGKTPEAIDAMFALRSSPYARTPAAEKLRPEIQRELLKTVNMLPPDVKLRVMDRVTFNTGQEVQGMWDGVDRLVYVSLAHGDPVRTARHETVHALRQSGLLSDQEFDTLYRAAEQMGLREAYNVDENYTDLYTKAYGHKGKDHVEAMLREEVIAEMFADYSLNGRRFANEIPGGSIIDQIIDTVVQFMERLRNSLDGLGFRDVRDVFEAIESGEVARRNVIAAAQRSDGTLYMIAGERAATADHAGLRKARALEEDGVSREAIWAQTGWYRGVDEIWRFEVSDEAMEATLNAPGRNIGAAPDLFHHQQLFDAYPQMDKVRAVVDWKPRMYAGDGEQQGRYFYVNAQNEEWARSIGAHEMQHVVQDIEGFAKGTSPEQANRWFARVSWKRQNEIYAAGELVRLTSDRRAAGETNITIEEVVERLGGRYSEDVPITQDVVNLAKDPKRLAAERERIDLSMGTAVYRRTAGEVEARMVQKRLDMTEAERRARPPWLDYDVPEEKQIAFIDDTDLQIALDRVRRTVKQQELAEVCKL